MEHQVNKISNMDNESFEKIYVKQQKPVIIVDAIQQWSALNKWSPQYFADIFGNKKFTVSVSTGDLFSHDKQHGKNFIKFHSISMKDLVNKISIPNPSRKSKYYLIRRFDEDFNEIVDDINIPKYGNNKEFYYKNLWFGEGNNITPLHFDIHHNFLAQVYGKKQVRLYSPYDSQFLYPTYDRRPPNHSNILDINNPDYTIFPNFKNASPFDMTLNPGDVLFIPSGWWHQVKSLTTSMSVNFWWKPKIEECVLPHILRSGLRHVYKKNVFSVVKDWINLNEYTDYLKVAEYLISKNHKWPALIFLGAFLKEHKDNTNRKNVFKLNDKSYSLTKLINKAYKEDDSLLDDINLNQLMELIQDKVYHV